MDLRRLSRHVLSGAIRSHPVTLLHEHDSQRAGAMDVMFNPRGQELEQTRAAQYARPGEVHHQVIGVQRRMKNLLFLGDTHIGSTVALCKPTVDLDDGGTYHASRAQRVISILQEEQE